MAIAHLNRLTPDQDLSATWLPNSVLAYLAHTDLGVPIRALARMSRCHPSTISRQISRWEQLRDECLIDEALSRFSGFICSLYPMRISEKDLPAMQARLKGSAVLPDDETFTQEARRVLRRLSEPNAVLALASDMEKGVVVRETEAGTTTRTAVVDRALAQALALKDWISCAAEGRVSRYRITPQGRAAVSQLLAEAENRASGFAEASAGFDRSGAPAQSSVGRRRRVCGETPLMILSRRRDQDGEAFLSADLVAAGERLREDFELAQIGAKEPRDWAAMIRGEVPELGESHAPLSSEAALMRTAAALQALGTGLGDVALKCCCLLDGLETTERSLGWSARSGKIVLRIALEHLAAHYQRLGQQNQMIG